LPLTDLAIRNAKPRERPFKVADSGGLFLYVTPSGGKLWRLKYRYGGKEKLLSFGPYPRCSLADARAASEQAKKQLLHGTDPAEIRRSERLRAAISAAETFGLIADEFLAKLEREKRAAHTLRKARWLLKDLAAPLHNRPVRQITSAEVLAVLRKVEAKGTYESAHRCRSTMSRVFRYAIASARLDHDPTAALRGALTSPPVTHHSAITDPAKVGELMRAIVGLDGSLVVRSALQLMALCFPRPGELRQAEWAEVDLEKRVWSIPASRAKMRRPHHIPLSNQAIKVLERLQPATGGGSFIFPGVRSPKRPLSENTLNAALRRLGYSSDEMTSHGFRTMASTLLNESGLWHPDAIERALAHQDSNAVRRAYARGEYWEERVRMSQWWADRLEELKAASGGRSPA
jgi:integrase